MSLKDSLLASALGYRLWSRPLNRQKVAAIRRLLEPLGPLGGRRVIDVGCGPGANAELFRDAAADYLGVDLSEAYVAAARRAFPGLRFRVEDATRLGGEAGAADLVLINSLLHHLDDGGVAACLAGARRLLAPGGRLILQEPLVPAQGARFQRLLMAQDRGGHFRPLAAWRELLAQAGFAELHSELYPMRILGLPGWTMYSALLGAAVLD